MRNSPEQSGVYGLYGDGQWVYISHCASIRMALLEYLSGRRPYVLQWQPKYFLFEIRLYKERFSRQKELVARYQPVCNRKVKSLLAAQSIEGRRLEEGRH